MKRCGWCGDDALYVQYHDDEWGKPEFDDLRLFEMLNLEGMQAGLSWITILRKRENYRLAFDGFDPKKIAAYDDKKIESLLQNPGIIRHRLKVNAIVANAKAYLSLQADGQSLSEFVWAYVEHQPIQNTFQSLSDIPAKTALSDQLAKDLKKRGFKFVGSTTVYAFMQATGMVNDHIIDCEQYLKCQRLPAV